MSRQLSLFAATLIVSLAVIAQSGLAQGYTSAAAARRQARRDAGAAAIADERTANAMLAVAALIGKHRANGELRQSEAAYAEVCLSTGERKFAAQKERGVLTTQQTSWLQSQAHERDQARYNAAQVRARQVRQGEWPRALRSEAFRPLREALAATLGDGAGLVATAPSIDNEQAVSIVAQMRRLLQERREQNEANDHIRAKKFLDDLKALTNEQPSADPGL